MLSTGLHFASESTGEKADALTAVLASIDWRFKTVCWLQGLPGAFQKSDRFAARARRRGEQRRNGAGLIARRSGRRASNESAPPDGGP